MGVMNLTLERRPLPGFGVRVVALTCCAVYAISGLLGWWKPVFWPFELAGHLAAVLIPAWYAGRRGAWIGATLATVCRGSAELVYFHSLLPFGAVVSSIGDSALWSLVLAGVFGEAAAVVVRQRAVSDAVQTFTRDVLTLSDPEAVLRRVIVATYEIVAGATGVAVWIRMGERAVCLAAAGTLGALRTADVPAHELDDPRLQRTLIDPALGIAAPLVAADHCQGTIAATCRRRLLPRATR